MSRLRTYSLRSLLALLLIALLTCSILFLYLYRSLPTLEGHIESPDINSPVSIERDKQGIPTISSASRSDTAYALGFLHGQERFFQMDTLRRSSAGELSELFGGFAADYDKRIRIHQFRLRAECAVDALPAFERELLDAYVKGVNFGLNSLGAQPFEYLLLQSSPKAWRHEDTLLVLFSMYIDLQPELAEFERSLVALRKHLPPDWFDFVKPMQGPWDATIDGPFNDGSTEDAVSRAPRALPNSSWPHLAESEPEESSYEELPKPGSNNWAITGDLSATGSAMVASDMHLGLRVPNIWYRASWGLDDQNKITGVTLPGTPLMIVGSNENVAWGFTNSYADWSDTISLELNEAGSAYLVGDSWRELSVTTEVIEIKGQDPIELEVWQSEFGPLIEKSDSEALAMRWVAHDIRGANMGLVNMERATNVDEALQAGAKAGTPHQNLVVADREGKIAWSIMGQIPERHPSIPDLAGNWLINKLETIPGDATDPWAGYLAPEQYPKVIHQNQGRIWTANSRVTGAEKLSKIGVGSYALGARSTQIRDRLFEKNQFSEADLLGIQLDDEARFMQTWAGLLVETASKSSTGKETLDILEDWDGHASVDSSAYRLVRSFRHRVISNSIGPVFDYVNKKKGFFRYGAVANLLESPVWDLVTLKPVHLVPDGYSTWDDFLEAMHQEAIEKAKEITGEENLEQYRWGDLNTLSMQHPISLAVPVLGKFLDMAPEELPGGRLVPRVQTARFGASQRMVVSPGHEERGIMHMPGGQSGHPLSPYYKLGHQDWVQGKPSSFLPGKTEWALELVPKN